MRIELPLSSFHGSVMGRRVLVGGSPNWSALRGLGLSLSLVDVLGAPSDPRYFGAGGRLSDSACTPLPLRASFFAAFRTLGDGDPGTYFSVCAGPFTFTLHSITLL